ncbi:fibronectin type III domain-containing protein [Pedobacter sp. CFBP9032]|uniref:fibronectin type III domain-containing protein n=1 Tax=Pedobacter sp. CFBP9032 TaxID=3096539 RepID=UPI002A69B7D7|nr:fibronectin type III domain-containing protein [Pedobacter sp. CFBP9032]MDY0907606.1 fibronectin type III domain-containing protein [Pedobacter sp. CFBP9032]
MIKNKPKLTKSFRNFLLFAAVLLLPFLSSNAQIYPVQVMPVLVPPYSLNTSDYYNGTTERLAVVLTNTDLQKPVLNVRLRMYIEGQNAKLQSRDGVYYPTITLDAGIPQRISLSDLAPYFNIDHLNFSGITRAMYAQSGKLPEGFYSFCFEVIEVNTSQVLSRKSCSMAYITLSDPPLLNLPLKGESIASRAVQNIIFQWTPRNLGSPNGAFNTEYEFTLKELWDTGIAPEAAFESTQPLYQVTVRPTTLLMGPAEPQLIPGKRYAWRVRAVSTSPTGEQADSYRNNGFSEIYWFTYQSDCKPPLAINSSVSSGRATINWTANPSNGGIPAGGYTLQYRERSLSSSKWYSVNTLENRAMLYDIKPGSTYEYRVGSSCVAGNIGIGIDQATYSDMLTLEINGNPKDTATVNCGMISPEISITNRTPIQALNHGDLIMAGGFPVKLTKVTGGGSFSGEGYVTIPMLGQLNVKVRFRGIQVNTERQLFGGVIETSYDPNEKQIADAKEVFDDVKDLVTGIIDKLKDLLKNPIKNREEIAKAEKEFESEYENTLDQLPITNEEKEERIAVYQELSKQLYLASNSSGIDEATIQAAGASEKLDELKESVKTDLENVKKIKNERIESLKTGELALNDLPDYPFNNHGEKQSYRERIQIGTGLHQLPRYEYKLKNPEGKPYSSGKDDGELYKFCLLRFVEPREHLISKDYYLDPRILLVQKRIDYFFTHPQPILSSASKSSTLKIYNFVAEALTSNDRNQNNKAIAQIKTNDNILYKVNLAEIIALTIAERKVLLDLIKSGTSLIRNVVLDATKLGADDATLAAARWIKPESGWYDIVVHGTPDNFMVNIGSGNWVSITHRDLLKYLISKGYNGKIPIRLISCNTGIFPDAIGKNLANKLGLAVKAPKGLITVFEDGTYKISNNAGWTIFKPGL